MFWKHGGDWAHPELLFQTQGDKSSRNSAFVAVFLKTTNNLEINLLF